MSDNNQKSYMFPLIIMTLLFFLLGFFTIMSNSMIEFLRTNYTLSAFQSQFVNMAFYGAYLLSIPAGYLIDKLGYRKGVVVGMLVITVGVGLFVPAIGPSFSMFMLPFFLIGFGDVFLNVAVNPYIIALGPKDKAAARLNLAGGLNSLATVIAPIFVSALIVDRAAAATTANGWSITNNLTEIVHAGVFLPAIGAAAFALIIAIIIMFLKLPEVTGEEDAPLAAGETKKSVWQHKNVVYGFIAIAMYVSAEVGVPSFLMMYYTEINATMGMPSWLSFLGTSTTSLLALYWCGLMIGRFAGSWLNTVFNPAKLLASFAAISALLVLLSQMTTGNVAFIFMLMIGLFHSIMWPNINDIGLTGVGSLAKKASGILCTGVAGAAILTVVMGVIAEKTGTPATETTAAIPAASKAYLLLFVFYGYIFFYALRGPKMAEK